MKLNTKYRLALDLGSTSLGWAVFRLNDQREPTAIIRAGVRIFSDGRNPKDGASLAVTRREARAMRRRRDRLLKRKARMMRTLIEHGFFPQDQDDRKALETLDPYMLRAKGLSHQLTPQEFGRALFHINQRRGFKSNRKTDKKADDTGALKTAISNLRRTLGEEGCKTVGEWLFKRFTNKEVLPEKRTVRARFRQVPTVGENGKNKIEKSYDLYIDRAMIEKEFDALWEAQSKFDPKQFNTKAHHDLKDCLLHQRPLKPVIPGRCTLMPAERRAPLALPSQQRFRLYQEVNHLRLIDESLNQTSLTLAQRDLVADALERNSKRSFDQIKKLLKLGGKVKFTIEDEKRKELKGNATSAILSKKDFFGDAWFEFDEAKQDAIAMQLLTEEGEGTLTHWLVENTGVDEIHAEKLCNVALPEGYGSLCAPALAKILPALRAEVCTYDKAVIAAGFEHHSAISHGQSTGEILPALPYYAEYLQRHVGFGTGAPEDRPEKRYGKIANPTVHIGLNQIRVVVNALIARYGLPTEVVVEVARDLKQSREQRDEEQKRQAQNQKRNERLRKDVAGILQWSEERVRRSDIEKLILWEELSFDVADRHCPYSGVQISARMALSPEVEVEHIFPFSKSLDDSLNNKTLSMRQANRIKGNRTPWEAKDDFEAQGWSYEGILLRAGRMPRAKRARFAADGYENWLKNDKGFLARALNDTRHLSKVAREYLSLICPSGTRVIPGAMTAMLRAKFGLNEVLGLNGEKNRNDHRHHAVDACVIGVTDQGLMQRFAKASASAREKQLTKLVEEMPQPFPTYRDHVQRAIEAIWVSHKPDHGYEGAMMEDTAWGLLGGGETTRRVRDESGKRVRETKNRTVIEINSTRDPNRHDRDDDGNPLPYKGYVGGSNFCMDIVKNEKGKWQGEIVSTFEAYQIIRTCGAKEGLKRLSSKNLSVSGKPLVMRLQIGDMVRMPVDSKLRMLRVVSVKGNGQVFLCGHQEANVDARNRDKDEAFAYISKTAGSLQTANASKISISAIGDVRQISDFM